MILDILELVLSNPWKFLGFVFILIIIAALIEGIVANICKVFITLICRIKQDKKDKKEKLGVDEDYNMY